MEERLRRTKRTLEEGADRATTWIGSTKSLVVHTILFIIAFLLPLFGVHLDRVLLVVTTLVSLEAIYLAIFIQMTVNKNTDDIEEIQEDIDEIQEDIEDIEEEQEADDKEDQRQQKEDYQMLTAIQTTLATLSKEIEQIKKRQ